MATDFSLEMLCLNSGSVAKKKFNPIFYTKWGSFVSCLVFLVWFFLKKNFPPCEVLVVLSAAYSVFLLIVCIVSLNYLGPLGFGSV